MMGSLAPLSLMIFKGPNNYHVTKFKKAKEIETIILNLDITIEVTITEIRVTGTIVQKDGNMMSFKEILILMLENGITKDPKTTPIVQKRIEKLFFTDCFFIVFKQRKINIEGYGCFINKILQNLTFKLL